MLKHDTEALVLASIPDAFDNDLDSFYWILIVYSSITGLLGTLLALQLWKMPTDDLFVYKACVFLIIGAGIRSASCIWILIKGSNAV